MLSALPPEAAGLLALLALVLLPGLLLVRAPWTVVPALSVAFWTLTWWWVPLGGRARALDVALVAFAALASLRLLPKHVVPPPPDYTGPPPPDPVTGPLTGTAPSFRSGPALVVVGVGLALLASIGLLEHVPGREMAFHTTAARAAVWRDALPSTHQPLLPIEPFGAHAPALATMAADVSLLSGLPPGRAVALVTLASVALLLLALFALLALRLPPRAAALAALLGLAAVRWPGFFAVWGQGAPLLALALAVAAAVLLLGHASRPSAVAAGMLLGAALLAQPLLTLAVAGGVMMTTAPGHTRQSVRARRLGLACGVALVLAAPGLWRLVTALSASEARGVGSALRREEVVDLLMGLLLMLLVAVLASRLADAESRGASRLRGAILTAVGAVLLLVRVTVGLGAGQIPPEQRQQLEALAREGQHLEAVCAPEALIDWVPALAGRPPGQAEPGGPEPWIPHCLRGEWRRRSPSSCSKILEPKAPGSVTTFDVGPRNPRPTRAY